MSSRKGGAASGLGGAAGVAGSVLQGIGGALLFALRAFIRLLQRSRIALAAFLIVCIVGLGVLIDVGINGGKAYPGVHIGTMDVSGKTQDEIEEMVTQAYQTQLDSSSVTIYASEEARQLEQDDAARAQNEALAEQLSVEDARDATTHWTANAESLGAVLHPDQLASQAYDVGRGTGGIFARLSALFGGWTVEPSLEFDSGKVENLASQIDQTVGDPRVDYGVQIEDGTATVTEGHDGMMLDRDDFTHALTLSLLGLQDPWFIAEPIEAPLRIDEQQAQAVCDTINDVIGKGVAIECEDDTWQLESVQLGSILSTRIEENGSGYTLVPHVDDAQGRALLLSHAKDHNISTAGSISFVKADDGSVSVSTDGSGTMPLVSEGISALDTVLFRNQDSVDVAPHEGAGTGAGTTHAQRDAQSGLVTLTLAMGATPSSLSFEDALNAGIVSDISSFTTEYANSTGTENRNHNIHLASDLLNNSIVEPEGTWSFNGITGERNAEAGFVGAGVIDNGEFTEDVGGGICQVATTIFNAVYESGLPITQRFNHSLYIASYPAGRDAAVSWPDLDLKWSNDTSSDILVRMDYDETSVTCTLYGVSPGYTVTSEVGEWQEGEPYKILVEEDESLAQGTSYVETAGTDGRSITVIRTVTDSQGNTVRQDRFDSVYSPNNEVVKAGPGTEVDTTRDPEESETDGTQP